MPDIPIARDTLASFASQERIDDPGTASIRQIRRLVDRIERDLGIEYVRLEMGVPGIPTPEIAIDAEIAALREGVSAVYPPESGIPELKEETARFVKLFLGIDVGPKGCIPTVGSLNGSFATFMVLAALREGRDQILFIDPGFPVHRQQARTLGLGVRSLDAARARERGLESEVERLCADGRVCAILYSNPNNPSWMCLSETELESLARVADAHDIVLIEDLAYFGMDSRVDLGTPGRPPYQPTAARYTRRFVLLISSSKIFSYAGQRVGLLVIPDELYDARFPRLARRFPSSHFGDTMTVGALYAMSAGVNHTAQRGLAALLRATNDGVFRFRDHVRPYATRAASVKKSFTDARFHLVYDHDDAGTISDGFYFTAGYQRLSGRELVQELLRYGVSAISLDQTGEPPAEGIRVCVSLIRDEQESPLRDRLAAFASDHR